MGTGRLRVYRIIRAIIYLPVFLLGYSYCLFAAAEIRNLSVSPATVAPGDQITVAFEMRTGGTTGRFAIAYSESGTLAKCENDWMAGSGISGGIYNRTGGTATYYIDGAGTSAPGLTYAGEGPNNSGITGPSTTTWQTVTVITNVPPEKAGTYTVIVVVRENASIKYDCNDTQPYDASASAAVTVSGATINYKLNLVTTGSFAGDRIKLNYEIRNYSESSVRGNRLAIRYYMNQATGAANYSQNAGNWQYYEPDGHSNGINYGHSIQFTNMTATDCPDTGSYTRMANFFARIYYSGGANIVVYPNGGYLHMNQDTDMVNTTNNPDPTDDYSRGMDNASLAENKYLTLYYNQSAPADSAQDVLQCEWTSASVQDSLTGEEPCAVTACSLMKSKSANVSYAYIGDTITYCISLTSTAQSDLEVYVWDTVPGNTLYLGCDNSCTYDGTMVNWIVPIAPGYSALRCFWVKVTGYPYIIRQGEFFAGIGIEKIEAAGELNMFAIDDWKYWMTDLRNFKQKIIRHTLPN